MKRCPNCGKYETNNNAVSCENCGSSLEKQDLIFCSRCGTQIREDMRFCPQCATPMATIYADMTGQTTYDAPIQQAAPTVAPPKKGNKGIIVLIAVILVILLVVGGIFGTTFYVFRKMFENTDVKPKGIDSSVEVVKDSPTKTEEISDEEAIEICLKGYVDAYYDGDEKALDYLAENADEDYVDGVKDGIELMGKLDEQMLEKMNPEENLTAFSEDQVERITVVYKNWSTDYVEALLGSVESEINKIEVDGDTAVAKITIDMADSSSVEFEDMSEDAIEDRVYEKYTEDEVNAMSEEELEEVMTEALIKELEAGLEKMTEDLENAPKKSDKMTLKLAKENGEWKITGPEK